MKSLNSKIVLLLAILFTTSNVAFAHSGHGTFEDSFLHYIYSYQHIMGVVLIPVLVFASYKLFRKIKS